MAKTPTQEASPPTFKVKQVLTVPIFQIPEETPVIFRAEGEVFTASKTGKNRVIEHNEDGSEKTISTLLISFHGSTDKSQIVLGAVSVSIFLKAGFLTGRWFRVTKHKAPTGKPKLWSVEEVEPG